MVKKDLLLVCSNSLDTADYYKDKGYKSLYPWQIERVVEAAHIALQILNVTADDTENAPLVNKGKSFVHNKSCALLTSDAVMDQMIASQVLSLLYSWGALFVPGQKPGSLNLTALRTMEWKKSGQNKTPLLDFLSRGEEKIWPAVANRTTASKFFKTAFLAVLHELWHSQAEVVVVVCNPLIMLSLARLMQAEETSVDMKKFASMDMFFAKDLKLRAYGDTFPYAEGTTYESITWTSAENVTASPSDAEVSESEEPAITDVVPAQEAAK